MTSSWRLVGSDDGPPGAGQPILVQQVVLGGEGVEAFARSPNGDGAAARLGVGVQQQASAVDEQHPLEQVGDLLDQVRRGQDGPGFSA